MKKTVFLLTIFFIVFSCSKDDEGSTPEPECSTPTNIQISDVSHNSVTFNWQSDSGSFIIEYGESGFTQGSGTEVNTTNNSYTLNNLNDNTAYSFYIKANCGNGNLSSATSVQSVTTLQPPVVPEFLTNLSELNLFVGDLEDLTPSDYVFNYELITPLFTDYSHKQRLIALPPGTSMEYQDNDGGLPSFPDNTLIAKTFYYNIDEQNVSLGKIIVETRVLIKQNGVWETGNYKWNEAQTDAVYTTEGSIVDFSYTDSNGVVQNLNYEIPSNDQCFQCHNLSDVKTPIGPKLRNMHFNNQLEELIANNLLTNLSDVSSIDALPNWEDGSTFTLDERARAYFDVNCAHCHNPEGSCSDESVLDLRFETRFTDTFIFEFKDSILTRMFSGTLPSYGMPLIGTTILHDEGIELIDDYISTL